MVITNIDKSFIVSKTVLFFTNGNVLKNFVLYLFVRKLSRNDINLVEKGVFRGLYELEEL